jgi:disulfide bond formation protein DsbB
MTTIVTLYKQFGSWLNLQRTTLIVAGVGVLTLITALVFEHIGGYRPCELCLKERVIYYVCAPAGLAAYLLASRRSGAATAIIALCGVGFLANAVLAAYHAGVEWHLWAGPSACTDLGDVATNVNDLLGKIKTERPVPCDVAQFRFAGISFAGYDALLSLGMTAFIFVAIAAFGKTSVANHQRFTHSSGKTKA